MIRSSRSNSTRSLLEVRGSVTLTGATEGQHVLRCFAVDTWNNRSSRAISLSVDFTPPRLEQESMTPHLIRSDQTATLSVAFEERGSGLSSASVRLGPNAD